MGEEEEEEEAARGWKRALEDALEVVSEVEVVPVVLGGEGGVGGIAEGLRGYLESHAEGLGREEKGFGRRLWGVNQTEGNVAWRLGVRERVWYRVADEKSLSSLELGESLERALGGALEGLLDDADFLKSSRGVAYVRPNVVDGVLWQHASRSATCLQRLYVLFPGARGALGPRRRKYAYGYARGDDDDGDNNNYSSHSPCGALGWIGLEAPPTPAGCRYAWLDLGAYSEGWGGRGRGWVPAGWPRQDSLADVAALIHRSATTLMVPPLLLSPGRGYSSSPSSSPLPSDFLELALEDEVRLTIWTVCHRMPCLSSALNRISWLTLSDQELQILLEAATYSSTRVTIDRRFVSLEEEPHLSEALQDSIRVDGEGKSYWDASALRNECRTYLADRTHRGQMEDKTAYYKNHASIPRVVDFFVFALSHGSSEEESDSEHEKRHSRTLLFDATATAVSYGDVVFTLTEPPGGLPSEEEGNAGLLMECGGRILGAGSSLQMSRAALGALLQTMWGVKPRHLAWEPLWGQADVDFLWCAGSSIHTQLSIDTQPTFVEKDSYPRAALLLAVDAMAQRAKTAMDGALGRGGGLSRESVATFDRLGPAVASGAASADWNGVLLEAKLALRYVGLRDYPLANWHAKEMRLHVNSLVQSLSVLPRPSSENSNCQTLTSVSLLGRTASLGYISAILYTVSLIMCSMALIRALWVFSNRFKVKQS